MVPLGMTNLKVRYPVMRGNFKYSGWTKGSRVKFSMVSRLFERIVERLVHVSILFLVKSCLVTDGSQESQVLGFTFSSHDSHGDIV